MPKLVKLKDYYFRKKDITFVNITKPTNCGEPYSIRVEFRGNEQSIEVYATGSELAQFEEQLTKYL